SFALSAPFRAHGLGSGGLNFLQATALTSFRAWELLEAVAEIGCPPMAGRPFHIRLCSPRIAPQGALGGFLFGAREPRERNGDSCLDDG
ncbi:MAG: hypothetical protein E6471_30565, partial [Bradyrhizobium sp.]|nr:hypothetical protein [Bradyrhizobium sp.]